MSKYKKLEEEFYGVYKDIAPQKIRKIVKIKLKIKNEPGTSGDESQDVILKKCLDIHPFAYLLGYTDTLEESLGKLEPELVEKIVMDPKIKEQLLNDYDNTMIRIFIGLQGAIDPKDIRKRIKETRANDFSREQLIQSLEDLMEEEWNKENFYKPF